MKFNKKRYRRTILSLKVITKLIVVALVIYLVINITERNKDKILTHKSLDVLKKYDAAVEDSTFDGIDKNGKKYVLHSKLLLKTNDNMYHMNKIIGLYDENGNNINVEAREGAINDTTKHLELRNNVVVKYDGFQVYTEQMDIDINDKIVQNNAPVSVLFSKSRIKSDRFNADGNKEILKFEGNVQANIKMSDF